MDITPPGTDPAANQEPAAPADGGTPPAPTEPQTPPADGGDGGEQLTPEEQALKQEDDEWDQAADELFPGLTKSKKEEEGKKPDEPAKSEEKPKEGEAPPAAKKGQKQDEGKGTGDAAAPKDGDGDGNGEEPGDGEGDGEGQEVDTAALDARRSERAYKENVEALKSDIRKQMFSNAPTELRDAQGDPINSVEDVMQLINPNTGDAFTREEAAAWFVAAQNTLNRAIEKTSKDIDRIAEVNLDLKDQADSINYRYGPLLKEMPDVREKAWAKFEKTLVKDEKTGIIIAAPISLEDFYEDYLEPYAELGRQAEAAQQEDENEKKAAEEAKKKAEEEARQKRRQDRSDIYGGGNDDNNADPEDKEWDAAVKSVYNPEQLKGL